MYLLASSIFFLATVIVFVSWVKTSYKDSDLNKLKKIVVDNDTEIRALIAMFCVVLDLLDKSGYKIKCKNEEDENILDKQLTDIYLRGNYTLIKKKRKKK
jgi:hypothetical protein